MSPVGESGLFLIQFIANLVVFVLILRFFMRATHVDWRHPIVNFVAKVTNPLCVPLSLVLPKPGRWDWNALLTAILIVALSGFLVRYLKGLNPSIELLAIYAIVEILNQMLDMMFWLIIIQVVLSWVSQGYNPNTAIFYQLAEPILRPFQKVIPPVGGLDLSPIVAIVAIKLTQFIVVGSIAQLGQSLL